MDTSRRIALALAASGLALGVAVVACASFSEEEQPPALADDGGIEGSDPRGDANDDRGPLPTPVCVPAPIVAVDAGEDADCEGTGLPVDLRSADQHCGRCGHSCRGDGCTAALCNVKEITSGEIGPPLMTVATSEYAYYSTTQEGNFSGATVRRLAFDGGAAVDLRVTSGGGALSSVQLQGPNLYVVFSTHGVVTLPADGSLPESTLVDDGNNNVFGLAVDATNIYWLTGAAVLGRAHADGTDNGKTFVLQSDPALPVVTAIISDGSRVYWTTIGAMVDGGPPPTTSLKMRRPGVSDNVVTRASGLARISALAFDADYIYWATVDGEISRAAKANANPPELVTRVPGPFLYAKGLAVDEGYVYAALTSTGQLGDVNLALYQAPKCGGPPRLMANNQLYGSGLLSAGGYLYWGHPGSVTRIAK